MVSYNKVRTNFMIESKIIVFVFVKVKQYLALTPNWKSRINPMERKYYSSCLRIIALENQNLSPILI
jgi:hypothetical protein